MREKLLVKHSNLKIIACELSMVENKHKNHTCNLIKPNSNKKLKTRDGTLSIRIQKRKYQYLCHLASIYPLKTVAQT